VTVSPPGTFSSMPFTTIEISPAIFPMNASLSLFPSGFG
jgi:hypothetical protein